MPAPRTDSSRRLFTLSIVALAFAVALTAVLGAASADAHSRTKPPHTRKKAAAHHAKRKVVAGHGKGHAVTISGSPSSYPSIGNNQPIAGGPSTPTTATAPATGNQTVPTTMTENAPVPPATIPPVTPEPPAQSLPTPELPTPAGLLFNGTTASDYSIEAAPQAVTEVPDPAGSGRSVFDLNVNNQDVAPITPTENPRAQMLSPALIHPGDEFWLETKFYLPKGMPYVPGWMSLVSIYGPPFAGSSPWQITIYEHEIRWMRNFQHDNDIPWKYPVSAAEGNWTTVLLHEKFATDGFVEMWVDGQQIKFFPRGNRNPAGEPETTRVEMATMDPSNDAGPNSAKIMQYRLVNMFQTASVYFQPLRLGTTRESVEY
jgi:hypothetical protein